MNQAIINLNLGLECALMRRTFLELQQDDNAPESVLKSDRAAWEQYLEIYVSAFNALNKPMVQ